MVRRPARWLAWAPLAVLPLLAAWQLNSDSLERRLTASSESALAAVGADWAKADFEGRDAILSGEAPDDGAAAAAVKAVAGTWGVRRVDRAQVKVVVLLPEPAISTSGLVTNKAKPEVRGQWPEDKAETLSFALPDRTYALGKDKELASDGKGNWAWTPAEPLKDGSYPVSVEITDGVTVGSKKAASGTLVVDTVPPPLPVFTPVKTLSSPDTVSGSWPEGEATGLTVSLDQKAYTLNTDANLTSQAGTWTLKLAQKLAAGAHDLVVEAIDRAGNVGVLTVPGAINVSAPPPPPTVDKYAGRDSTPAITGKWDETAGHGLTVAIGGKTYEFGKSPAVTSDGKGAWALAVPDPLKDGIYDVVAIAGAVSKDETVAEVEIDTTPPPAPTVKNATALPVTGTFDPGDTKRLTVTLAGKSYVLGTDAILTSDGGNWSLLLREGLAAGRHDVIAAAADVFGNVATDQSKDELVIAAPPEPETSVKPPTVAKYAGNDNTPILSGTFDQAATKDFMVAIAGRLFTLNKDAGLAADGKGAWSLAIAEPLRDGIYDLVATANGSVRDETVSEVEIDTTPPPVPVINNSTALPVTGTFAPRDSKTFRVTLAGKPYSLGQGGGFSSAGENWSLAPPETLPPGTYDVAAEAVDAFGNRSSDQSKDELVIAPPPPPVMTEPTVDAGEVLTARPFITGTWSEGIAADLTVALAGNAYELGKDEPLSSADGIWKLAIPAPLKDGVYDIEAISRDGKGAVLSGRGRIVVDAAGPAMPTVRLYSGEKSPSSLSGTWAEGDAVTLAVTMGGKTAVLGTNPNLTSDGKGNWGLTLREPLLPAGSHDVQVLTADKRGRVASDQTRFEILIKESQPPQPPATDCNGELSATLKARPIRFESDRTSYAANSREALREVAAIAGKCPDDKLEIGGHTDSVGSRAYNQALSESRAVAVLKSLVSAGVDAARLTAIGYGEDVPLASNDTPEGRAENRRIEVKIAK